VTAALHGIFHHGIGLEELVFTAMGDDFYGFFGRFLNLISFVFQKPDQNG